MPHEWLERWCQSKHHSKSAKGKEKPFLLLCFVLDYVQEDASLQYNCQSPSCVIPACSLELDIAHPDHAGSPWRPPTHSEKTVVFETLQKWKVKQPRETADPFRLAATNTEIKLYSFLLSFTEESKIQANKALGWIPRPGEVFAEPNLPNHQAHKTHK